MKGQWLGAYTGFIEGELSVQGKMMVNIDEMDSFFRGVISATPENIKEIPASIISFKTKDKSDKHDVNAYIEAVNPYGLTACSWNEIKHLYAKDIIHSNTADANVCLIDGALHITAKTDQNLTITAKLSKAETQKESRIVGVKKSWIEFKNYLSELDKNTFLFRGQQKPWKLQTSFHRRGRYCIDEFLRRDIKVLHQKLSALTSHYFDLNIPEQNGAFFNLLQHHGYPTPLLDWSYSPYVSAFFAFRDWPSNYEGKEYVRIYIFNNKLWQDNTLQSLNLNPCVPHLSVQEFIAINNSRLVPQQALTTVTNIDDIEDYLLQGGEVTQLKFIEAIDIPANEREVAMQDLRYMGITAGSMFPGLDGACEELREQNFS